MPAAVTHLPSRIAMLPPIRAPHRPPSENIEAMTDQRKVSKSGFSSV